MKTLIFTLLLLVSTAQAQMHGVNITWPETSSDIEYVANHGAKLVRHLIFLDPNQVNNYSHDEFLAAVDSHLSYFDSLLAEYRLRQLPVILVLFQMPKDRQTFIDVWRMIATRYAHEDAVYGFDLINEPKLGGKDLWNLQEEATKAIRAITDKTVCYTVKYGLPENFAGLKPGSYSNLWYTFHMYAPMEVTHQGIYYPLMKYPSKKYSKKTLIDSLKYVTSFHKKYPGENIYVGEGAISFWADEASKGNYTKDLVDLTRQYQFTYFFVGYGYNGLNQWSPTGPVWNILEYEF